MMNVTRNTRCIRLVAVILLMTISMTNTPFTVLASKDKLEGNPTIELKGADVRMS